MSLFILRHGKAEFRAPSGRDADRRLEDLGRAQAAYIGLLLSNPRPPIDSAPSIIITSPVERAHTTAAILCEALAISPQVDERLSLQADLSDHLELLRSHFSSHSTAHPDVLLVGHNPTLDELIATLVGCGDAGNTLRTGELVVVSPPKPAQHCVVLGRFRLSTPAA